jgi:hypothetical protein
VASAAALFCWWVSLNLATQSFLRSDSCFTGNGSFGEYKGHGGLPGKASPPSPQKYCHPATPNIVILSVAEGSVVACSATRAAKEEDDRRSFDCALDDKAVQRFAQDDNR